MNGGITGLVLQKGGSPLANASVVILRGPGPAPDISPVTSTNGEFTLDDLPPGEWVLRVRGPVGEIGEGTVQVAEAEMATITIKTAGGN